MSVRFRNGHRVRSRARAGVTLVEVVVVLVVVSIATALVGLALSPGTRAEDAEFAKLLEHSRSTAVRRAETMRLTIDPSGRWTLAGATGTADLTAQGQLATRLPQPIVVLISPFGTCALDVRSETLVRGPRLDPMTCVLIGNQDSRTRTTVRE